MKYSYHTINTDCDSDISILSQNSKHSNFGQLTPHDTLNIISSALILSLCFLPYNREPAKTT